MNTSVRARSGHYIPFTHPHCTNDGCLDSLVGSSQQYWVPSTENNDQLYWLDKFYTASQSPQSPESGLLIDERQRDQRGLLLHGISRGGGDNGENLGALNRDGNTEQLSSQLVVNASSRGIIGNQGFAQAAGESRWWAHQGPGSTGMPESSFEPPMFGQGHMAESQDEFYESEEDNGGWLTNGIPGVPSAVILYQRMEIQHWTFHLAMCMRSHGMCQAWFSKLVGQWDWRMEQSDEEVRCVSLPSHKL